MSLGEWCAELARRRLEVIEKSFITYVEIVEGRVPTNDEIAKHGMQNIHPDGTCAFRWRGKEFLRMPPLYKQLKPYAAD